MTEHILASCSKLGKEITKEQAEKLTAFHAMLIEANKTLNLTRVADEVIEAADRNYIDSLMPYLITDWLNDASNLLDVGSGAGFPGIPLSIVMPHVQITLLDSLAKRVDFLNGVIKDLGLNAQTVHMRAEEAAKQPGLREVFDIVTARAVAALPTLCELCLPFVRVGGAFIDYHGPKADIEIPQAAKAIKLLGGSTASQIKCIFPERDWDHRLIRIEKNQHTPKSYPRKPGDPGRKPLGVSAE